MISVFQDFNVVDMLKEFEDFDELYEEVVQPLIDSVNSFSDLLDVWNDTFGHIDLGLGINDVMQRLHEKEGEEIMKFVVLNPLQLSPSLPLLTVFQLFNSKNHK